MLNLHIAARAPRPPLHRWTPEELAVLRYNYARGNSRRLSARILARSWQHLSTQECQLGLYRTRAGRAAP